MSLEYEIKKIVDEKENGFSSQYNITIDGETYCGFNSFQTASIHATLCIGHELQTIYEQLIDTERKIENLGNQIYDLRDCL